MIPISVLFGLWYAPTYGYSRTKGASYALAMIVLIIIVTQMWYMILGQFIPDWGKDSYVPFLFVPLFAWAVRRMWKIPILHGIDFVTPIIFFSRAVALIGSNILGCARAVPCAWGIYSPNLGYTAFPMDLIEMLGHFTAAIVALIYARKLKYNGYGRIFALSMYITGFVRLFIQLGSMSYWWIRGINEKSVYSIVAIMMAIVIYRISNSDNKIRKWRSK